jgi:branched-chain amino acid transport system substrate-binding protein
VFRFCGRDDAQGAMASAYLANRWSNGKIAILHDGQAYGEGLAVEVKKALNAQGVTEQLFEVIDPGRVEYVDIVDKLEAADIDALCFAGCSADAAFLVRELRQRGNDLEFIAGDGVFNEDFGLIAGAAGDGMRFTAYLDTKALPAAADAVAVFRAGGREPDNQTLVSYAVVQTWAQAVEQAGTLEPDAVIEALRSGRFDTVFGRIGFDEKGDVTGYEPFMWYVWQDDNAVPVNGTH